MILTVKDAKKWLNARQTEDQLESLLTQYPSKDMSYYEVSTLVNNASNDQIECIHKV